MRSVVIVLLFFIFSALTGCKERQEASTPVPVVVHSVTAEAFEYRPQITLLAELKPFRRLLVTPRIGGFLTERNFREGEFVKSGALLYRIQRDYYELAVAQSEAQAAKALADEIDAKLEFDRIRTLIKEDVAAPKRFDMARAKWQSAAALQRAAEAKLNQAKLDLSYTAITAPFDGWIGFSSADVGDYIGMPSPPLAELIDVDPMRVEFNLSDRYLTAKLVDDLAHNRLPAWDVTLKLPDGSAYPHRGEIRFWSNLVDPDSATLRMQAVFPNPERRLLGGLYGMVTLTAPDTVKAIRLDARALLHEVGGAFVYVLGKENVAEFRPVETGLEMADFVVIRSGLQAGETVILAGNPRVRPGVAVSVVPALRESPK